MTKKIRRSIKLILILLLISSHSFGSEKFFVKDFLIVGNRALNWDVVYEVVKPYKEKYLTLNDLKKLSNEITKLYIKKGFITSRAYIPPQSIDDGIIIIKILEGKVGDVISEGKFNYYSKEFVQKYFDPLKNEKAFNKYHLEKVLLVLNNYTDLSVKADLRKGSDFGTTDIKVEVKSEKYPFSGAVFYDNYGSEYTSRNRYGINLNAGNLLIEGSNFSLTGIIGDSYDKLHTGSASYQFPIGSSGFKTGMLISLGNSNIGKELAILNIKSYSEYISLFFSYPILKTLIKDLTLKGSINFTNYKQSILNQTTTKDKYRYLELGVGYLKLGFRSKTLLEIKIVQGLGEALDDVLGSSSYNTRSDPDKTFTKVEASAVKSKMMTDFLMIILKLKGQYSDDTLLSSQNFYIGGPASIRGYLLSQFSGDSGYSISGEMRIVPFDNKELFQFAIFGEIGQVFLNKTAIGQYKDKTLTGAGFGIRSKIIWDINITADLAFPIDPEVDGDDREYNFYCQIIKTF